MFNINPTPKSRSSVRFDALYSDPWNELLLLLHQLFDPFVPKPQNTKKVRFKHFSATFQSFKQCYGDFSETVGRSYSVKKLFLKYFAKFTGKHLCHSLFLIKRSLFISLFKKRFWHRCMYVCIYVCMYVCVCVSVCPSVCLYVCMYVKFI